MFALNVHLTYGNCSGATETISLLYIISLHVSAFLKNHHQALYNIK